MNKVILTGYVVLCAYISTHRIHAAGYVWDNSTGNGIWNDPINWGMTNNSGFNTLPTASDGAIFLKNFSPGGTVRLNADATAQYMRQDASRAKRTITIHSSQTVDRTLTFTGTAPGLIDGYESWVDFAIDGTPNANGARLKLKIDGSGTNPNIGTRVNKATTFTISCDVSGAGGFNLNGGLDGAGRLILSGANTYTGPTIANSGVIVVNGTTASGSAVSVNGGGILGGIGTIGGPVTVNPGGLISPGVNSQSPLLGTLTISNNLTLAGDVMIEVNRSSPQTNDMVFVSGTLVNTGVGSIQVLNYGPVFEAGDKVQVFNKPLVNGQALRVFSAGTEIWTNKLAVDGSIEVLSATNTPITGDPTTVFTWRGTVTTDKPWKVPMQTAANWAGNQAPQPLSSNIFIFEGDLLVPYQWPYIDTNYGASILIFSNNTALNSIKILGGSNRTVSLGSYVRQDTAQPCYYGITGPVPIKGVDNVMHTVNNAFFTNVLGDASCGSRTEFQCTGGRLDVYGVIRDGAGTSSRLIKSGNYTLNLTGNLELGNDASTYTGGTVVNAGTIKLQKLPGFPCIPGDVIVNGTGGLQMNIGGGEQIGDWGIVTLNDSGRLDIAGQPETIQTVQGSSPNATVALGTGGVLIVSPSATNTYNGGLGVANYAGNVSGSGTVRMNGTGTFGMLGVNSAASLTVNSGTLKVNGNSGTGAVTVNGGGTLLAKGTIAGAVTVGSSGTFGAGLSAGKATLSAGLNMSASGNGPTNLWELAAFKDNVTGTAGTDFDQIVVSGSTLNLGSQATLDIRFIDAASAPDFANPFWGTLHTWRIVLLSGGSNPSLSNFGRIKNGNYPAGNFTTSVDATGILLTYTPSAPRPRITSLTGAGTGSVTVQYTNTLPGVNYVLSFSTNLNSGTWFTAGNKTAFGTGDSQTDNSANNGQRYYRIHYLSP